MTKPVSVNAHALPIVKYLIANADKLRLKIDTFANGATLIDAGIETLGSLEAGRLIGEICMGGLGTVTLTQGGPFSGWPTMANVHSTNPVISCLGSQYAGWSLSHGEGKAAFYALGSGPARALAVAPSAPLWLWCWPVCPCSSTSRRCGTDAYPFWVSSACSTPCSSPCRPSTAASSTRREPRL